MTILNDSSSSRLNVKHFAEQAFLLSPVVVLVFLIFNIEDTKWILSRLIPVVCLYALVFHRHAFLANIKNKKALPLFIASAIAFVFYSASHLLRDDNFGFARTLITSLAYLLFIPWDKIDKRGIQCILVAGSMFTGLNALFEYFYIGVPRVGIAINPIPYASSCAVFSLSSLLVYISTDSKKLKALSALGFLLALTALILTDVRGVILFFPVLVVTLVLRLKLSGKLKSLKTLLLPSLLVIAGTFVLFGGHIGDKFEETKREVARISSGKYDTSIGVRLDLWQRSSGFVDGNMLVGIGDKQLLADIREIPNRRSSVLAHLHNQYIDSFVRYGAIGLIILVAWLFSIRLFANRAGVTRETLVLNDCILLVILIAGLSDVPFHHTHMVYLFSMLTGVLLLTDKREGLEAEG